MTTKHWWNYISKGNRSTRSNLCPRVTFSATNLAVFIGPATQIPKQCFRLSYNFFFPHPLQYTAIILQLDYEKSKPDYINHMLLQRLEILLFSWFIAIIPSSE